MWIFPDHPALYVDFGGFLVLFGIAFVSTSLAYRIQHLILAVIIASLVSMVMVFAYHGWLIRRHLRAPFGDVRSGLFVAVAEWAARKVMDLRLRLRP